MSSFLSDLPTELIPFQSAIASSIIDCLKIKISPQKNRNLFKDMIFVREIVVLQTFLSTLQISKILIFQRFYTTGIVHKGLI